VSIEQEFLKIKLRDYSREIDLIRILNAKLEKICRSRVSTILFSFAKNTKVSQIQKNEQKEFKLLVFLSKSKSKSKNNKIYKKQSKKKKNKNLEFFKKNSFFLLRSRDSILRSSLLNFKLFEVISTTKSRDLITKIARIFLKIITIFISTNKKNNAKNYLYIKVNIDLQYRINYCFAILIKVFQLIELVMSTKKQKENLVTIILKSIVYIAY